MGYRSTVAYVIRFIGDATEEADGTTKGAFFTFLCEAKANENTAPCFRSDDALEVDEEKLEMRFFAEDVKWYESYSDVKCHECLLGLAREWTEHNASIGYAFARIGEDADDVTEEVYGSGDYDWVGVNRSIYCDWMA